MAVEEEDCCGGSHEERSIVNERTRKKKTYSCSGRQQGRERQQELGDMHLVLVFFSSSSKFELTVVGCL